MNDTNGNQYLKYSPSCDIESAAMYLMGFSQADIQLQLFKDPEDPLGAEYFSNISYQDIVEEWNSAQLYLNELQISKNKITQKLAGVDDLISQNSKIEEKTIINNLSEEKLLMVQTYNNLDKSMYTQQIVLNDATNNYKQLHSYKTAIINELARGSLSSLDVDMTANKDINNPFITLISLKIWSKKSLKMSILEDLEPIEPKKRLLKTRQQEIAIVDAIKMLGHDPKKMPAFLPPNPWIKSEVRELVQIPPLFNNSDIFDSAWERLRKTKEINTIN